MTLDTELRAAVATLEPPATEVPAFAGVRRRHQRARTGTFLAVLGVVVALVVGGVALVHGGDAPRITSNPHRPSLTVPPATPLPPGTDALGLSVQLPEGWALQSGVCPAAQAVTVVDQITALPVPAGCPNVDGPWVVIQRIPTDLDGIDEACGPGYIDSMPFCQAIQVDPTGDASSLGIERRFYAGLDVLVSLRHDERAGGPGPEFAYADPAVAQAVAAGVYQTPQPLLIAKSTIEQAMAGGCSSLDGHITPSAVHDCESLTFPTGVSVTEAGAASLGGTVPATYWIVSLTGENETARYRVLVENHWDTRQRWVDQTVTAITRYDGPWPPDPATLCTTPPIDPRFQPPGPTVCPIIPPPVSGT